MHSDTGCLFLQKKSGGHPPHPHQGSTPEPAGGCATKPLTELDQRRLVPPHLHCMAPPKFPTGSMPDKVCSCFLTTDG